MKVLWLRRADARLVEIADYIAEANPAAAYAMTMRLRRAGNALSDMPYIGRPGRVAGTRELVVVGTPYLLAYRVTDTSIHILHVLHGRQQWPEAF
jgi:toxin ParE1/3/4